MGSSPDSEDPTCHGTAKPVCHNYWPCSLEPVSHNSWAREPQLLSPCATTTEAHMPRARALQQEKPLQRERNPHTAMKNSPHSTWLEKAQLIYDKNSPESRHRGNLPQHNKGHIWQTHSQHRSQWWKTETISSKIRNKTRMPMLTTIIQHSFGSFSHSNQRRKRK